MLADEPRGLLEEGGGWKESSKRAWSKDAAKSLMHFRIRVAHHKCLERYGTLGTQSIQQTKELVGIGEGVANDNNVRRPGQFIRCSLPST